MRKTKRLFLCKTPRDADKLHLTIFNIINELDIHCDLIENESEVCLKNIFRDDLEIVLTRLRTVLGMDYIDIWDNCTCVGTNRKMYSAMKYGD